MLPYLFLVLSNLFWAGNWVTGRAMRESFGPLALNFWRWLVAVLVLAPFVLPQVRRQWPLVRRNWKILAALSLCGVVLFQSLVYLGLRNTSAINGVLINSTLPVAMIAVSWLFDRDTVTPRQVAGLVVSMLGVVVIVTRGALYIGLFASVAAFACWNAAVAAVGPNVAGFSIHLLPAFGTLLAIVFLGEHFELFHLWGVAGIFTGVALATVNVRPGTKV